MDLNLPVFKKCCFFVPLRYGLLTWGYLKLVSTVIGLIFFILLAIIYSALVGVYVPYDIIFIAFLTLGGILLPTEIVLHIIFIIGAHAKNVKLLRVYYYYAIFMWVSTIVMSFVGTAFLILSMYGQSSQYTGIIALDVISFICSIIVQSFLILSLRSEIIKLRSNCPYSFVRNENEPEGTIISVKEEDDISMDTTARIL